LQQLQKTVVEGIRYWAIEAVVKQAVLKVAATFTGLGRSPMSYNQYMRRSHFRSSKPVKYRLW
jgi:hypothetical protein